MPTPLDFEIHEIRFSPGSDVVAIAVRPVVGPHRQNIVDLYTTTRDMESADSVEALATDKLAPRLPRGLMSAVLRAACRVAAAQLGAMGCTLWQPPAATGDAVVVADS